MKVLNVSVWDLKPGMVLFEDLLSDSGTYILGKDTSLEENHIMNIKSNGILKVKIRLREQGEPTDGISGITGEEPKIKSIFDQKKIQEFRKIYTEKVDEVTQIIKEIGRGGTVNMKEINSISKHIIRDFKTLSDVINYLHLVRPMDDYTYAHSLNVSLIAIILGRWLNFPQEKVDELATAGLLHDIGKTKVSQELLSKPGKLTEAEFDEVKKHSVMGFMIIESVRDISPEVKYAVLMHHEKIDGSGYPTKAKDDEIPEFAKIIAVADIYDAMTSNRTYRSKMCPFDVIKNFEMHTYGKLDTKVLTIFLKNIANSYLGDFVELSNGEIAEIVFINPNRVWQPIVRSGDQFIDLSTQNQKIFIKEII